MSPRFAPAAVEVERRADGTMLVRSPATLRPHATSLGALVDEAAARAPERDFLVERSDGSGWRRVTWGEARRTVRELAAGLLATGALSPERPLLILSDNSIDHALLALAAMYVGIPVAPLSTAYSLLSRDHARLRAIAELVTPGLVFAEDALPYERALAAIGLPDVPLVARREARLGDGRRVAALDELRREDGAIVDATAARVGPDTVAKILFTSGSTGVPKGVLNTQRMLCANQEMIAQCWPFLDERPPVVVDWLPWSHTFGGNHNFNLVLRHAGTLHVDRGKPAPGLVEKTVAHLREVSPTLYFNVPRGYDALLPFLERDPSLRDRFFAELDLVFYAAAALPQPLWDRLSSLARQSRREPPPFVSAWGATETAPMVTTVHFPIDRPGVIGLPAPGVELKLVPSASKLELRVRGPNVTPGYWRRPDLATTAFDDEGYYRIGDAGRFLDENEPARGLAFDGRVAEDFKLTSGTWVHTGALRLGAIAACAPVAQDVVVAGHDRDAIALLVFPSPQPDREAVRARVREGLRAWNRAHPHSSQRVARALVLDEPASIDAGEITDKGYINQRAVLARRAHLVEQLYDERAGDEVLRLEEE